MALGATLTFVLLVGIVQVLRPAIEPVDPYGITGALQKEAQMDRIAEGDPVDIVFTGTSQILVSLDPTIVDATAGTHSYNAALTGGTPQVQVEWLLDQVVPTLHPRQVVIGVSHLDLLDESPRLNEVIDSWNEARKHLDGPLAELDRALSESVAIIDRRQSLRDPAEWVRAVFRGLQGTEAPPPRQSKTLTPEGQDLIWSDLEYHGGEDVRRFTREEVVPTWSVGTKQSSALREMLVELQAQDIEVVLVMMPLTQDLIELHPNGLADVTEGEKALEALAEDVGVDILRYSDSPWPDEIFADPLHLNGRGAELFSSLIAADVAASDDGLLHGGDHTAAGDSAVAEFVNG